jgi:TatD DNase family protein
MDLVEGCISVCCDPELWKEELLNWLTQEPNVWLTIGCHPSKAKLLDTVHIEQLKYLLKHNRVVAVGEMGIDETFYLKGSPEANQLQAFEDQLMIAKEMDMPICIHLRGTKCVEQAREIMKKVHLSPTTKIHMHCFSDSKLVMTEWMEEWPGMMFGVTPNFFQSDVGFDIPLNRLLLETDAPYFPPKKLNENGSRSRTAPKEYGLSVPGMVFHTAAQIASLRNSSIDVVLSSNRSNIEKLYGVTTKMISAEEMKIRQSMGTRNLDYNQQWPERNPCQQTKDTARRHVIRQDPYESNLGKVELSLEQWMCWYGEAVMLDDDIDDVAEAVSLNDEMQKTLDASTVVQGMEHNDTQFKEMKNMEESYNKQVHGDSSSNYKEKSPTPTENRVSIEKAPDAPFTCVGPQTACEINPHTLGAINSNYCSDEIEQTQPVFEAEFLK